MSRLVDFFRHPWLVRGAQIVIGLVFLAAALPKIGDPESFALSVHHFRIVPLALENLVAIALPWIELVAGLALVLGIQARAGGAIVTVLMAVFTVAVAVALARGLDFECGCFGTGDGTRVGATKLLENTTLLLLASIGSLRAR
jgi:putative oxidoreductase